MDTKLIDVFVSYSRIDAMQVDTWIKGLRRGGVRVWHDDRRDVGGRRWKISARAAAERCEVLIWFVSKYGAASRESGEVARMASANGKAVMIVNLDTAPVPPVFDVSLPGVTVVDAIMGGRPATWEAIVNGVRRQGVPWIPRTARRRVSGRPNERRRAVMVRAWLRVIVIILMIFGLVRLFQYRHWVTEVASASASAKTAPAAQPLPVKTPEASPHAAPAAPEPAIPTAVPVQAADPHSKRAIEFVAQCIAATDREHGLTQEQIDAATSFFADPLRMPGEGIRPRQTMKATLQKDQQQLPRWHEVIHFIEAKEVPDPACREVSVQLSYSGTTAEGELMRGVIREHYTVDFTNESKPKITEFSYEDLKPQ